MEGERDRRVDSEGKRVGGRRAEEGMGSEEDRRADGQSV